MAERRPRRPACTALLALAVIALAGCSGVPTSGSMHVGAEVVPAAVGQPQDNIRVLPPRPSPGMSEEALVAGFLGATVDSDGDYGAARAYLATGTSWNTSAGITTYNQGSVTLQRVGSRVVEMTAPQVGTMTGRGDYVTAPGRLVRRFTLVRQAGQWRISRLPTGVLLATDDAQHVLQMDTVYFLNPAENALVPEQLLVPQLQPGLATTLVRALVSGAPPQFASSVHTAVPPGTRLLGNVPIDSNGIAEVDLAGVPPQLSVLSLAKLSAQIGWTLKQIDVKAFRLLIDGEPLVAPGFSPLQTATKAFDPSVSPSQSGLLFVRNQQVHSLGEAVPDALAHLSGISAPETSADGTAAAALRHHRARVQLLIGASSGPASVRLTASRITAPSFDPAGDVVVAADTAAGGRIVELSGSGKRKLVGAPASLLAPGRHGRRRERVRQPRGRAAQAPSRSRRHRGCPPGHHLGLRRPGACLERTGRDRDDDVRPRTPAGGRGHRHARICPARAVGDPAAGQTGPGRGCAR
jgi:Sporulation and spore germination/Lipoprotein LpqB beta-propeller domain